MSVAGQQSHRPGGAHGCRLLHCAGRASGLFVCARSWAKTAFHFSGSCS